MGRARPIPRSRVPLHRRLVVDPGLGRRWLLVAALATVTGSVTQHVVADAESTRARWGRAIPVVVTTRSRAPGDPLAGSVRTQAWPAAIAPAGSLTTLPAGARATGPLDAGVPLTPAAVTDGRSHPGSGPDRRRVALAQGPAPIPVAPGDRVEVWATVDPSLAQDRATTRRVVQDAVVTAVRREVVVVAVPPDDVRALAEAAALATVTLVATA